MFFQSLGTVPSDSEVLKMSASFGRTHCEVRKGF